MNRCEHGWWNWRGRSRALGIGGCMCCCAAWTLAHPVIGSVDPFLVRVLKAVLVGAAHDLPDELVAHPLAQGLRRDQVQHNAPQRHHLGQHHVMPGGFASRTSRPQSLMVCPRASARASSCSYSSSVTLIPMVRLRTAERAETAFLRLISRVLNTLTFVNRRFTNVNPPRGDVSYPHPMPKAAKNSLPGIRPPGAPESHPWMC